MPNFYPASRCRCFFGDKTMKKVTQKKPALLNVSMTYEDLERSIANVCSSIFNDMDSAACDESDPAAVLKQWRKFRPAYLQYRKEAGDSLPNARGFLEMHDDEAATLERLLPQLKRHDSAAA